MTTLTRALSAAAALALTFTTANTTDFAARRGVPVPIALLLDPMLALALGTALLADARLTALGLKPPRWSAALRWFTALAATAFNTWDSLWPRPRAGRTVHPDPAAILLHAVPPLLVLLLAETVAAYRSLLRPALTTGRTAPATPVTPAASPTPERAPETIAALLPRARAFDAEHRARHGRPASVARLRTHLHVSQSRAQAVRTALHAEPAAHPDDTTTANTDEDTPCPDAPAKALEG